MRHLRVIKMPIAKTYQADITASVKTVSPETAFHAKVFCDCLCTRLGQAAQPTMRDFLTEINECDLDPCENGGTCVDLPGRFECQCPKGFNGDRCQKG